MQEKKKRKNKKREKNKKKIYKEGTFNFQHEYKHI